jgi:hypothetical protein
MSADPQSLQRDFELEQITATEFRSLLDSG